MARRSAADSSTTAPLDSKNIEKGRIQPPEDLDQEVKRRFNNIVAGRPPHWFGYQDVDFLVSYCKSTVEADLLHDRIMVVGRKKSGESMELRRLITVRDRVQKTMIFMANKMRLTQTSTIQKIASARLLKQSTPGEQDTKSGGVRNIWDRKSA